MGPKDGLISQRLWLKCIKFKENQANSVDRGIINL